jgi:hypothetical protein
MVGAIQVPMDSPVQCKREKITEKELARMELP